MAGKDKLRAWALDNKKNFETMLSMMHSVEPEPYDFKSDPDGELAWRKLDNIAARRAEENYSARQHGLAWCGRHCCSNY